MGTRMSLSALYSYAIALRKAGEDPDQIRATVNRALDDCDEAEKQDFADNPPDNLHWAMLGDWTGVFLGTLPWPVRVIKVLDVENQPVPFEVVTPQPISPDENGVIHVAFSKPFGEFVNVYVARADT